VNEGSARNDRQETVLVEGVGGNADSEALLLCWLLVVVLVVVLSVRIIGFCSVCVLICCFVVAVAVPRRFS
jgi:hypothetical protein